MENIVDAITGKPLHLNQGALTTYLSLIGNLDQAIECYDLSQLVSLEHIETLENNKLRIDADHSHRSRNNIVLGAIVGGLIDYSLGSDSVFDGLFLGAAAGWFLSPGKTEPTAHVMLHFSAGERLGLNVTRAGLNGILTKLDAFAKVPVKSAFYSRPLTENERARLMSEELRMRRLPFLIGALLIGIALGVIFTPESTSADTVDQIFGSAFSSAGIIICSGLAAVFFASPIVDLFIKPKAS